MINIEFIEATDKKQIEMVADIAKEIWAEYFPHIITVEQINYMVEKYQSASAIARQISDEGYKYFAVSSGGEGLGYFAFKMEADKLFLSKFYLKKEFRGKGYFSKMLSYAEQIAMDECISCLYLTVNKRNDNSIEVYRRKGFIITKEQVTDIGGGFIMDDYIMEKLI